MQVTEQDKARIHKTAVEAAIVEGCSVERIEVAIYAVLKAYRKQQRYRGFFEKVGKQ